MAVPSCFLIKKSSNAWGRRFDAGQIGRPELSELAKGGVIGGHNIRPVGPLLPAGKMRQPPLYTTQHQTIQSPVASRGMRKAVSSDMQTELQGRRRMMDVPGGSTYGYSMQELTNPRAGIGDSKVSIKSGQPLRVILPPKRMTDVPGVWDSTAAHELGHVNQWMHGAEKTGFYSLKDRLLFHKLEKRAPGILMNPQYYSPAVGADEALAEHWGQKFRNLNIKPEAQLQRTLSHLRLRYDGQAPYVGNATLGKLRTFSHMAPYLAQTKAVEPMRNKIMAMASRLLRR